MSELISIAGLDKASVLAALYNAAQPQGLGFLQYDPTPMSPHEARSQYGKCDDYYDYLRGRVMKVDLSKDSFDPWLYDRDNGSGAAKRVIDALKNTGETNPLESITNHHKNTVAAAKEIRDSTKECSGFVRPGIYKLGIGDFSEELQKPLEDVLGEDNHW